MILYFVFFIIILQISHCSFKMFHKYTQTHSSLQSMIYFVSNKLCAYIRCVFLSRYFYVTPHKCRGNDGTKNLLSRLKSIIRHNIQAVWRSGQIHEGYSSHKIWFLILLMTTPDTGHWLARGHDTLHNKTKIIILSIIKGGRVRFVIHHSFSCTFYIINDLVVGLHRTSILSPQGILPSHYLMNLSLNYKASALSTMFNKI